MSFVVSISGPDCVTPLTDRDVAVATPEAFVSVVPSRFTELTASEFTSLSFKPTV